MKLVCVVGPTGCGKTWLGVELAKMLGGEVVSCDSMQIYRGMAIGTAAPTAEEMQGIPHHMVGVADPRENYSVARYADDAAKCVDDILSRGKQPVIVGGTGLYLNALLAGHGFAGGDKDGAYRAELERRWEEEGGEAMFVALRRIDPKTAGKLHLNDKKRILRALEVYYETGKTMVQHNAETKLEQSQREDDKLTSLQTALEECTLTATMDGTITALNATVGDVCSGTVATIQDVENLTVEVTIPASSVGKLSTGMTCRITSDATGDAEIGRAHV